MAFAVMGTLGMVGLVRSVGLHHLVSILRTSAVWLPFLFLMEGLHIVADASLTYAISQPVRERVSLASLARIHIIGFAVGLTVPAGHAAAEATRAALLSRSIGVPNAAAVGATSQSMSLLGGALIALPCLIASLWKTGASALSGAILLFTLVMAGSFATIQVACRLKNIGGFVGKRFAGIRQTTLAFQDAARNIPIFPWRAVAAAFVNRAISVGEYALLLFAIGQPYGLGQSLLAVGVSFIGGSLGDLIPGQMGATDGAFALAAPILGMTAAEGIGLSVMLHGAQVLWALVGWTLPLWWRATPIGPTPEPSPQPLPR